MNNLVDNLHTDVYANIKRLMENARTDVVKQVNNILVKTYWEIGRIIVEDEQGYSDRAEYGKTLLKDLSKMLTKEFGRGFSVSNLQFMRRFYQEYEIQQTLSVKLSWSRYCELLSIDDKNKRSFYEKETVNANWSVRELKRQINTSLFERLLLSSGDKNKEKVLDLALKGNEIATPNDIIKDPYVFEFLGLPEEKPIMESDLEKALVTHKTITKQLISVELIMNVTEYQADVYYNSTTGERIHAVFPSGVVDDVNYDGSIKALLFLLNTDCAVSIDKSRRFLSDLTGGKLKISKGMINKLCREFSSKTQAEQKKIFADLISSAVMHTDFTNVGVNG